MANKDKKTKVVKKDNNKFVLSKETDQKLFDLISDLRAGTGSDKQRMERVEAALAELLEG